MCTLMKEPADTKRLREALGQFPTGVAIVTTRDGNGEPVGLTINSFSSISLIPPLVAWCIDRRARSYSAFRMAEQFTITVLADDQVELAERFATPGADRFFDIPDDFDAAPIIPDGAAWFECTAYRSISLGDHLMLIGQVRSFDRSWRDPLLFAQGSFQALPGVSLQAA